MISRRNFKRSSGNPQSRNGQLSAVMVGSTGSLTTIEYEPGVVEDLKRAINLLAPPGIDYAHEAAWHDGNGHSHVQAALLGPSIVLPIRNGNLKTGTWQQLVAINHDNHPRTADYRGDDCRDGGWVIEDWKVRRWEVGRLGG